MTAEQVVYNHALIEQEMSLPTVAEQKQIKESGWSCNLPIGMKAPKTEAGSAWVKQMCVRMKAKCMEKIEAETTAACEDFKQRFIADRGQAEWDHYFEPPGQNPLLFAGPRAVRSHAGSA